MSELYPDAIEEKPNNTPKPKEKFTRNTCSVDADHGGDQMARRTRTGILIYVNKTPIVSGPRIEYSRKYTWL